MPKQQWLEVLITTIVNLSIEFLITALFSGRAKYIYIFCYYGKIVKILHSISERILNIDIECVYTSRECDALFYK